MICIKIYLYNLSQGCQSEDRIVIERIMMRANCFGSYASHEIGTEFFQRNE